MKTIFSTISIVLCIFLTSCKSEIKRPDAIRVKFGAPIENFTSLIESVEYIPLETDSVHHVGYNPQLYVGDDSYYIVDDIMANDRIYRYDLNGKFLNQIGRRGRGPGEFGAISSFQLLNDTIIVFSYPHKMLMFTQDGNFIRSSELSQTIIREAYYVGDGYLIYNGFGDEKGRLFFEGKDSTQVKAFLMEKKNKCIDISERKRFSSDGEKVFIRETWVSHIVCYQKDALSIYRMFDFGEFSLPDSFFKIEDQKESIDFLNDTKHAMISKYLNNSKYEIVEIDYADIHECYGLFYNDLWTWFDLGVFYKDPLAGMLKDIREDSLYFLVFPQFAGKLQDLLGHYAKNPDAIRDITEESNFVIVKITLKQLDM